MSQANQMDIFRHSEENRKEEEQFVYVYNPDAIQSKFEVLSRNEKPEIIYKFYGFENHHVNAFLESYLYAAHPFELNDILDCSSDLIFTSKQLDVSEYERLYQDSGTSENLKTYYKNDKDNRQFISTALSVLSNIYGIISLTAEKNHPLMWAHYAQEKGFQIKFETKKLEESIQGKLKKNNEECYGFFPVNYVKKIEPIDIQKFSHGISVPFLYSTNVKLKNWSYENEWRLIVNKELMGVPNSKRGFNRLCDFPSEKKNRYVYYDKEVIKEICVGRNFFNSKAYEVKWLSDNKRIKVKPIKPHKKNKEIESYNNRIKFLNHILENFSNCFYWSDVRPKKQGDGFILKRIKEKLTIEKENNGFYMLTRTNNIIDEHE